MRLVVASDLHVGPGTNLDIFAGRTQFPEFVDSLEPDDHLVINGDGFDFLMDQAPLGIDRARARAERLVAGEPGRAVLSALKGHLGRGGRVTVRPGNHDLEVLLPDVQEVLLQACPGLAFDATPVGLYELGGCRIAVGHGEEDDDWNRFPYDRVRDGAPPSVYPPGSQLVKHWLNPAKDAGLRFADLLKPDFAGAGLAVLAVRPGLLARAPKGAQLLWRLLRRGHGRLYGAVERGGPDWGGLDLLDPDALAALEQHLSGGQQGFARSVGDRVHAAWLRAGLSAYARFQRFLAGPESDGFFSLDPEPEEWNSARAVSASYDADVVMFGHTHAARLRSFDRLLLVNTGTWIELLRVPPPETPLEAWTALLDDLRTDPVLAEDDRWHGRRCTRFTAALATPEPDGVRVSLVEWRDGRSEALREVLVRSHAALRRAVGVTSEAAVAGPPVHTLEGRRQRLEDELSSWEDRPDVDWALLTPRRTLDLLVAQARTLLDQSREATTGEEQVAKLVAAEGVFQLYRDADAQRRNHSLGRYLQWADAVAIDGYTSVLVGLGRAPERRAPLPLVYVQPTESPATYPRGETVLSPGLGAAPHVELTMPVILLPPDHLAAPGLLTMLLHEVGHDLDRDLGIRGRVLDAVRDAAGDRRDLWVQWAPEILADVIGVHLAGPWFAESLYELAAPYGLEWTLRGVHPPLALRMELVLRALLHANAPGSGEVAGRVRGRPALKAAMIPREYLDDVDPVLAAFLDTPLHGSDSLGAVLGKVGSASWRELPGRAQQAAALATDGDRTRASRTAFEKGAAELPAFAWQVDDATRRFMQQEVLGRAPTLRDPVSLFKAPPQQLLVHFDECAFVGSTNGQLAGRLEQALKDRGRPWTRIELFFLDVDLLPWVAVGKRSAEVLKTEQDEAIEALRALLETGQYATSWALYRYDRPFYFASLWKRAGERRVHVSPQILDLDVRYCPAVDYRGVDGQENPDLERYFEGLENLRRRCRDRKIAGSPDPDQNPG